MEHGRILTHVAVKVHIGTVRSEVEQVALDFQRVFVLSQPVEELEEVLLLGVESAVFIIVPAQVPQQCRQFIPITAIVKFNPRPCGEIPEEPFFPVQYERVRDIGHVRPIPCHVAYLRRALNEGGTAVQPLRMFPDLAGEFLVGKTYGTFRHEEPLLRAEAERIQVTVIRFSNEEMSVFPACRRQAFPQVVVAFLRNFTEGLA